MIHQLKVTIQGWISIKANPMAKDPVSKSSTSYIEKFQQSKNPKTTNIHNIPQNTPISVKMETLLHHQAK